jgi:hypothetical protein
MAFNMSGFAVGLLIAQQQHLPSSSAVAIGALTSVMGGGFSAMGIVLAMAMARQQAPAASTALAASGGAVSGGGTGTTGATTGGAAGSSSQGSGTPLLVAVAPAPPLPPPATLGARAVEVGHDWLVRLHWEPVDGATGYQVSRVHKNNKPHLLGTVPSPGYADLLTKPAKPEHFTYEVTTVNADGVAGTSVAAVASYG